MPNILFHLRYRSLESTYLAFQLAHLLQRLGISYSILSYGYREAKVNPNFDSKVIDEIDVNIPSFISKYSHIIYFSDCSYKDLQIAKTLNVESIYIANWRDPASSIPNYLNANKIVSFSPSLASKIQRLNLNKNVFYIPIHLISESQLKPLPVLNPSKPNILLNLRFSKHQNYGKKITNYLRAWFHQTCANWTLWLPSNQHHKKSWINKCFTAPNIDSSFNIESKTDWDTQRLLYASNDLMIWPSCHVGFGLPVITSLTFGCPILGFNISPINEYVIKENSILVPVHFEYDKKGLGLITPDLDRFNTKVINTINNPSLISNMKTYTGDWSKQREELFECMWKRVLNI